jgi:hypothetical protein
MNDLGKFVRPEVVTSKSEACDTTARAERESASESSA